MIDYIFRSGITLAERARSEELLVQGLREKWSINDYQTRFGREGLGYRRENIIKDIFHVESVGWARTDETQRAMESRYQNLLLPYKEKHDLTRAEMSSIMSAYYRDEEIPEDLAEALKDYEKMRKEFYEELE